MKAAQVITWRSARKLLNALLSQLKPTVRFEYLCLNLGEFSEPAASARWDSHNLHFSYPSSRSPTGSEPRAIFWFLAGFSGKDICKLVAKIARSSNVKVVDVMPRHWRRDAKCILAYLNSCQGKQEFCIVKPFKVEMSAYIMARDINIQFNSESTLLMSPFKDKADNRWTCVPNQVQVVL